MVKIPFMPMTDIISTLLLLLPSWPCNYVNLFSCKTILSTYQFFNLSTYLKRWPTHDNNPTLVWCPLCEPISYDLSRPAKISLPSLSERTWVAGCVQDPGHTLPHADNVPKAKHFFVQSMRSCIKTFWPHPEATK